MNYYGPYLFLMNFFRISQNSTEVGLVLYQCSFRWVLVHQCNLHGPHFSGSLILSPVWPFFKRQLLPGAGQEGGRILEFCPLFCGGQQQGQ